MQKEPETHLLSEGISDLSQLTIRIGETYETPTREEFYTNYPFFKYWKKDANQKLQKRSGINIYVHIPFCMQICDYCFYMKELVKSKNQVDEYIDTICKEIQLVSEHFSLAKQPVNSIYIGGGTPSILTESQFKKLTDTLYKYHDIADAEFTFEAEPGTFNRTKLEWYKSSGINRISMGVQSFDDEIIKLSSRKHTAQQALTAIKTVKDVGNFTVNIDLLSGLAGETMDTWEKSVDTALDSEIDMLTIYKMKAYSNTVFFEKGVHNNIIKLPSAQEEVAFMTSAIEKVRKADFKHWTTFAFTKKELVHRYAENTWRGEDCIAYGASSFGSIGGINYQNLNSIALYTQKVNANELPLYRSYELTYKDRIVKELLLCSARLFSYSKEEFRNKFGFDYFNLIPETIEQLTDKGYIQNNTENLVLTDQGILFGDYIGKVIASSVKEKLGSDSIGFTY